MEKTGRAESVSHSAAASIFIFADGGWSSSVESQFGVLAKSDGF